MFGSYPFAMCFSPMPAMRNHDALVMLFFAVFFSVGAAAVSAAILYDDLLEYYTNRQLLRSAEESLTRLESLNADYDGLLRQLRQDPNLVERIAPVAVGAERTDQNTVNPTVTPAELDAARRALTENPAQGTSEPVIPRWLSRCSRPGQRITLFLSGAFLILLSFMWFGPKKRGGAKG